MLYIFDWDGTIIDSTDKIVCSMHAAIAELGLPERSYQQAKNIIGLGLPEAVRQLYPDIAEVDSKQLRESYSRHFIAADQVPCGFYPGVTDVLAQLKSAGHQLAVATGKSRRGLSRVLANLEMTEFFDTSRCADETSSKPHPLMLHEILEELSVEVDAAVMIGDTAYDLEMAANAGMASVGVSYGAHSREMLLAHKPVSIIDRFDELLKYPFVS